MGRIYVPSAGLADWQRLLAEPERQWRAGFSAMSLAQCWEAAGGLPLEIGALFRDHGDFRGESPELLLALPEWKVPLPGGRRDSQNDVFALVRCTEATIAAMIEGKIDEPFGPTLGEWLSNATDGKRTRLAFIRDLLGLGPNLPLTLRYQLLHRTASAIIEARRFGTTAAAMIVHSFSKDDRWFDDFAAFCALFGARPEPGQLMQAACVGGWRLYLAWARGEPPRGVSKGTI